MNLRERHRRRKKYRGGAAASELAMLLPVFSYILMGTCDYARVMYDLVTVTNCARNGALFGGNPNAAGSTPYTSVQQAALADAANLSPVPTVTTSYGTNPFLQGYCQVTVTYTFTTLGRYPGIPTSTTFSRTVMAPNLP